MRSYMDRYGKEYTRLQQRAEKDIIVVDTSKSFRGFQQKMTTKHLNLLLRLWASTNIENVVHFLEYSFWHASYE